MLNGEDEGMIFLVFIRKTKVVLYYEKRNMMQMNDASMLLQLQQLGLHYSLLVMKGRK